MAGSAKPRVLEFDKPTPIGNPPGAAGIVYDCRRNALLVSENHYKLRNGRWSGGGPFYVIKETLTHTGGTHLIRKLSAGGNYRYYGVAPGPTRLPTYPVWKGAQQSWAGREFELNAQFATGWARARPGNPVASLGQFLVELRDLPAVPFKRALRGGSAFKDIPRIALKELSDFRNLGSEYLNVVFGWKPFVSDLRKMYNLWHDVDKRMAQIVRENGKHIRRRAGISKEESISQPSSSSSGTPWLNVRGGPPNWAVGSSKTSTTVAEYRRSWFSGSFRYYIPDTSSSAWDQRARLALFGALPTPGLLYEVLPWSWLLDWFANVGDVVSNASMNAVDNLTSSYAYVMEHKVTETTYQTDTSSLPMGACLPWICEGGQFAGTVKTLHKKETKSRSGTGNPFGLGVLPSSLSGYQWGILAALGISRSSVK